MTNDEKIRPRIMAQFEVDPRYVFPNRNAWAWAVIANANFRCEGCGDNERLEAHHLDGDKHNNVLLNGVSLCKGCHVATDTAAGRNYNGKKCSEKCRCNRHTPEGKTIEDLRRLKEDLVNPNGRHLYQIAEEHGVSRSYASTVKNGSRDHLLV